MKIEIVEMEDRKAKFILKDSSPAMANALRRTMLQDIPKMAIDKVEFHLGPIQDENDLDENAKEYESVTSLFDEVIAHRLGMIPVPTDYSQFTFRDKCECGGEGCPHCTIMYSLNKHGPATVMSGDLLPLGDSSLKVKDEFIPIVELTADQAVLIYATAVMGTAKQHVKWQAAFGVGYSYEPEIEIDPNWASDSDTLKLAETCPGLFAGRDGRLEVADKWKAISFGSTASALMHDDKPVVKITWKDDSFLFKFETDGSLTARQVLDKAVEILSAEALAIASQADALVGAEEHPVKPRGY